MESNSNHLLGHTAVNFTQLTVKLMDLQFAVMMAEDLEDGRGEVDEKKNEGQMWILRE